MSALTSLSWAAFALFAILDWVSLWRGHRTLEVVAKPAAMVALLGVVLTSGELGSTTISLLLLALTLCLLGDVLLLSDGDSRFLAGLSAFLLGHLAYAVLFLHLGLAALGWAGAAALGMVALLPFAGRIIRSAHRTAGALGGAVTAYIVVIAAMAVLGWWTGHVWIGVGVSFFVVSDTILGWDRFVQEQGWGRIAVMVTYFAAQALIVVGVLTA